MSSLPVSCVVPAYNEVERIADVLHVLEADSSLAEIIVVDDGSTDCTRTMVEPFAARDGRFRLICLPDNFGKAAAMAVGAQVAASDAILFLDADLCGLRLEHVRALIDPVLSDECAMTVGRFMQSDGSAHPAHVVLYHLSGQRCLRWSQFQDVPDLLLARYGAETALNLHARKQRLAVQTVPLVGLSHEGRIGKRGLLGGLMVSVRVYRGIALYGLRLVLHSETIEGPLDAIRRRMRTLLDHRDRPSD
jgi:polyisoprenyl-phosphate glycosyltransferase